MYDHPDPDGELEAMTVTELLAVRDEAEAHPGRQADRILRYIDRLIERRMGP